MDRLKRLGMIFLLCGYGPAAAQVMAPVKVVPVERQAIADIVEGYGVIQPYPQYDVKISAVSPMRIESILVRPGDRVKKGQEVLRLQRDQSIDVAVQKAKVALQQAELNLQRARKLFKNGVIPRVKFEQAQTQYNLAKADYEIQQRSREFAVQNSDIRSPIDGSVSSVKGVVGQIADPSMVIIRIVNVQRMIAVVGVEVEDIKHIAIGQPADVRIPNLTDGGRISGKVVRVNKEIDPVTQLVHIWIDLPNSSGLLQPGMFAEARIYVRRVPDALVVPRSAILTDARGTYVFVVQGSKAKKVYVKAGIRTDRFVQVVHGLHSGEKVVFLGNYELEDGIRVKMVK